MQPLSIMIKPASSRCPLRCRYCFYLDEAANRETADRGIMSRETANKLIHKALAEAVGMCSFFFQGGEPLLAGEAFYRAFVEEVERSNPRNVPVSFAIQTNGLLLTPSLCRFFKEKNFLVGISLDGLEVTHDRYRVDGAGRGTYAGVMEAIALLREYDVDFNVLTVVTDALAEKTEEVFEAYCKLDFRYQQYIPCMEPLEGPGCGTSEAGFLSEKTYGEFLERLFRCWLRELEKGNFYSIRHFDNWMMILLGYDPDQCSMRGVCSRQIVVEADGSVYPCDFYALDSFLLGNVNTDEWADFDRARRRLRFIEDSAPLPRECRECRWLRLCRNGCRRDRFPGGNEMPGRTRFCESHRYFFYHTHQEWLRARELIVALQKKAAATSEKPSESHS